MTTTEKPNQGDLQAFAALLDVKERLRIAGMKIALAEQAKLLNQRELDLAIKEEELAAGKVRHEEDIALILRTVTTTSAHTSPPANPTSSLTIMEVWEQYKTEKIADGKWKDGENSARREHEPHVRTFCLATGGDRPICDVTHVDVRNFKAFVMSERPDESPSNREKRISRAGSLFRWAKENRFITDDFSELFKFTGKKEKNTRLKFSSSDLRKLFESDDYRKHLFKRPSEYWIPTLALFTGARLNELAQIQVSDIGEHEGVATLSLTGEEKRLKTDASHRIIPIHSKLIELGFLSFVRSIGQGRIFPELTESKERPGDFGRGPSRRFTDYRRTHGVGTETLNPVTGTWEGKSRQDFHSFRTTFIDALRKAKPPVPKERRERIVGHESEGTQNQHYDGGDQVTMYSFLTLKDDVEQARFDVDFTPFSSKK